MDFESIMKSDFENIAGGDFSTSDLVTDGDTSATLKGVFYGYSSENEPDTNSVAIVPVPHIVFAETATTFDLHRIGLLHFIKGQYYKTLNFTFDGLGGITHYLELQRDGGEANVPGISIQGAQTEEFVLADAIAPGTFRLKYIPKAKTLKVTVRGVRLKKALFQDNGDGTFTILNSTWYPIAGDIVIADYYVF
jgi:hypothetical protein